MEGDLEGIPSDSQESVNKENILKPLDVKEDAVKDQLGNSVYFKFYNENEIPQEAREKIAEHVQKYKNGEYINEVSAIYISAGNSNEERRKIIVKDEKDKTVLIKDEKGNLRPNEQSFKGMQVIFDKQGIPTYLAFSKEIERINSLRIMAEKAGKDFLTDLDNQHGLDKYLESLSDSIRRERYKMDEYITIFFADLNDLKSANRGGHTEGDQYILMMARLLQESFKRKEDEKARRSGDEFIAILLTNIPFEQGVKDILENKQEELIKEDPKFNTLKYSAGVLSIQIKDLLKLAGVDENTYPKIFVKKIKEEIQKQLDRTDKVLLDEAKKRATERIEGGKKPTYILARSDLVNKITNASGQPQANSPLSAIQP